MRITNSFILPTHTPHLQWRAASLRDWRLCQCLFNHETSAAAGCFVLTHDNNRIRTPLQGFQCPFSPEQKTSEVHRTQRRLQQFEILASTVSEARSIFDHSHREVASLSARRCRSLTTSLATMRSSSCLDLQSPIARTKSWNSRDIPDILASPFCQSTH